MSINLFKAVPTGEELNAIRQVLESGWWAQGAKVKEFELAWADRVGAKYAVATNSCSAALDIAVRLAGFSDEVTVSPFTFASSALAILHAGKKVKFVDIDDYSMCTPKADVQVFYGGNEFGEGIVYDMAHAGGIMHRGLISCWSFHAVIILPTGDGGMLTTNDPEIYRRAKALAWCGIDKTTYDRTKETYSWDYNIEEIGYKSNMNDITAAIGLCQMVDLEKNNFYRYLISKWYYKYLPEHVSLPFNSSTWHLFTIRVANRDELHKKLAEHGITTGVHYKPLYKYPIFPQTELPVTEKVYKEILSLPMHLDLKEEDIKYICSLI